MASLIVLVINSHLYRKIKRSRKWLEGSENRQVVFRRHYQARNHERMVSAQLQAKGDFKKCTSS
jgi:hypothetical protein